MTLLSLNFAIFVCITAAVYFVFPKKYRWTVLLAAGYYYYLSICNIYVLYMLVTTVSTWFLALSIGTLNTRRDQMIKRRKESWTKEKRKEYKEQMRKNACRLMLLGLVLNFGILGFLKYTPLAVTAVNVILGLFKHTPLPAPGFLLPLGISFYTFQAMGYLIDVYQEKVEPEKNLAKFALFVSFFPQIIQGPIAMYDDLAPQLYEPHSFDFDALKSGAALILWGVMKKMIIADRAVKVIEVVTADSMAFPGTYVLMTALIYALQLYADFSGGIDVVRGVAEIFGIKMAENFRRPYFAMSLTEYWHRWHITLGNWVRAYVFYPLSLSKPFLNMGRKLTKKMGKHFGKVVPTSLASVLTFLIIGIWHGAEGKYIMFGLWNGLVIMVIELLHPVTEKVFTFLHVNVKSFLYRVVATFWTFILVLIGYYFDIARNTMDAFSMIIRSVTDFHISNLTDLSGLSAIPLQSHDYGAILVGGFVIFVVSLIQEKTGKNIREILFKTPTLIQWMVLWAGITMAIIFGYYGSGIDPATFVYMQF